VPAVLDHKKILGETIRRYRKKANLTQEKLAELADLNPKYIGELERGENTISVAKLVFVAKALGVRVRDLVRDI
jgi:transcriptional regulator with XRE-family HTH domain